MKKFLLTLFAAVGAFASVNAQSSIFNNPENKAYAGFRVGADITCPGAVKSGPVGIDVFNNGSGIEFGGIYNVPVIANLYVEPGLKLYYNTYSFDKKYLEMLQDDIIFNSLSIKKFGMRIPVMAGYHFDFTSDIRVSVFTGPVLEVGFTAKECVKGHNYSASGSIYGNNGSMNRVDLLWGFGAGVTYRKYYLGISGNAGLLNMYDGSDATFRESVVAISLGYNF